MTNLIKQITNGRLLKNNGSWMYCSQCDKTVGYLCYSTYLKFEFNFKCNCGNVGSFHLLYPSDEDFTKASTSLKQNKNRLCCPNDDSPLFSIVDKNIKEVEYKVVCKQCKQLFTKG